MIGVPPRAARSQRVCSLLKTGRIGDSPAGVLGWAYRCFMHSRRKQRSLMRDTSRSANCGARTCFRAVESRSQFSGRLEKSARPTSRGPADHPSGSFGRARPEAQEWEAVQEMLLASGPRFLRMAYAILRNKEDAEDAVHHHVASVSRRPHRLHLECRGDGHVRVSPMGGATFRND